MTLSLTLALALSLSALSQAAHNNLMGLEAKARYLVNAEICALTPRKVPARATPHSAQLPVRSVHSSRCVRCAAVCTPLRSLHALPVL